MDARQLVTIKIDHTTTYQFNEPVSLLPHRLMLRPRESRDLRLISSQITVTPTAVLNWPRYWQFGGDATFRTMTSHLVIRSFAELELSGDAWPVFDIAVSAMSYPFRYSNDEWTDLGALAMPQGADQAGYLRAWAREFVRSNPTDTLSAA